jgi:hypothetical protein
VRNTYRQYNFMPGGKISYLVIMLHTLVCMYCKTSYRGVKLDSQVQNFYLCVKFNTYIVMKVSTWVHFLTRCKTFFLGMLFHTWYKVSYLGAKFHTWVQNFIPGCKISYLGAQFHTWVKNSYMGAKIFTCVQNFVPGYRISYSYPKFFTQFM